MNQLTTLEIYDKLERERDAEIERLRLWCDDRVDIIWQRYEAQLMPLLARLKVETHDGLG